MIAVNTPLPIPVAAIAAGPERSDHDRVDEAHAHPADFSEDNGAGETEEGTEFGEHATGYRLPSTGSRPRHAGSR